MTTKRLIVPEELSGERVDVVVARMADVSRSTVRAAIDAGEVMIGGTVVKPSERVESGAEIVAVIKAALPRIEPDDGVPFEVLHEDASLLVVDKPAGVVVHKGAGATGPTLVNGLLARYPDIEGVGQEGRWGIVHRLDRDTSGLLVVARSADAYGALVGMIKRRSITRRYLSLVTGSFSNATGTIEAPIGRDPRNRTRMTTVADGREATTHYRRLASWPELSRTLLSVHLDTGRTHQIRVHMQAIEHPIVGDRSYGRAGGRGDPGRPWLHAGQLVFSHPIDDVEIDVTSPLPKDLSDSVGSLGSPDAGTASDVDGTPL